MRVFGDLLFWACLLLALTSTILAAARPQAVTSSVRTAGIDLVILQDGSASMHVEDMPTSRGRSPAGAGPRGDRWQRSMQFLRMLGESLRWEDDRIALALFARIATPQIRLTRDPNTFFFFLDHLQEASPFRIEDDSSWDTNIERGIYWGLRLVDADATMRALIGTMAPEASEAAQQARDVSKNAKAFVLVSDGQAWSGEAEKSIAVAKQRGLPIYVVGVGTTAGGPIPDPMRDVRRAALVSALDRNSLAAIATAGGGRYFEIGQQPDREIANTIIDAMRRRAVSAGIAESREELYPWFLLAAAVLAVPGLLSLRNGAELTLQIAAAGATLAWISTLF